VAQGAFAGIRNVATHTKDEWTEQVALEHLAVLSVLARWADETELVKLSLARNTRGSPAWLGHDASLTRARVTTLPAPVF